MGRRVVFDTSVLVRAAMSPLSWSRRALDLARNEDWLLASEATLEELTAVLLRPKFDHVVDLRLRLGFLKLYATAVQVAPISRHVAACRDARDDKFLEVAINGKADCIVTEDADLMVLGPFEGVEILSPTVFLDQIVP